MKPTQEPGLDKIGEDLALVICDINSDGNPYPSDLKAIHQALLSATERVRKERDEYKKKSEWLVPARNSVVEACVILPNVAEYIFQLEKERDSLQSQLKDALQAGGFCDKHTPNGGVRNCLVCGCEKLSFALDKISYICGKPNKFRVSEYSSHCNEEAVVKQVEQIKAQLDAAKRDTERLDWMVEYGAYVSWSSDGEVCNCWFLGEPYGEEPSPVEGFPQKIYCNWREAIDAAITNSTNKGTK